MLESFSITFQSLTLSNRLSINLLAGSLLIPSLSVAIIVFIVNLFLSLFLLVVYLLVYSFEVFNSFIQLFIFNLLSIEYLVIDGFVFGSLFIVRSSLARLSLLLIVLFAPRYYRSSLLLVSTYYLSLTYRSLFSPLCSPFYYRSLFSYVHRSLLLILIARHYVPRFQLLCLSLVRRSFIAPLFSLSSLISLPLSLYFFMLPFSFN